MQVTLQHGYPDLVGKRSMFCGSGSGPASYVNTGTGKTSGDPITVAAYQYYIDSIMSGGQVSLSGTYFYVAQPSSTSPRRTWVLRYFVASTAAEVANGTNLSAESFIVSGLGGTY
jgi:hypothetical protein